jgi:hypothetical protein
VLRDKLGGKEDEMKLETEVEDLKWMKERKNCPENFDTFEILVQKE